MTEEPIEAPTEEKLSCKQRARELRREAYQRMKAQRAKDPKFQAMKEAARRHRHDAYQTLKEKRKVTAAEQKKIKKAQQEEIRATRRAAADKVLLKLVKPATEIS